VHGPFHQESFDGSRKVMQMCDFHWMKSVLRLFQCVEIDSLMFKNPSRIIPKDFFGGSWSILK